MCGVFGEFRRLFCHDLHGFHEYCGFHQVHSRNGQDNEVSSVVRSEVRRPAGSFLVAGGGIFALPCFYACCHYSLALVAY